MTSPVFSDSRARAGWASRTTRLRRSRTSTGCGRRSGRSSILAGVGLVAALLRRSRADLVLLSFVGVYWLTLMPQAAHFDRYVLPLVPALAVLAGSIRPVVPFALVALAFPLVWSIGDARELTNTDTRLRADAWVPRTSLGARRSRRTHRRCPSLIGRWCGSSFPAPAARLTRRAISRDFVPGA